MIISTLRFSPLFIILFCLNFSFFPTPLQAQTVSESDSLALVALYNSTNGDNWTRNDNWLEGDMKTWYGVSLGIDSLGINRVLSLSLNNNNLTGSIPVEIGNFKHLSYINFSTNDLTGNIPPSIGNLSNLSSLYLSSNELEGAIPAEIGNFKKLKAFQIHQNKLSGAIPVEIGSLTEVENINFRVNNLSGNIPSEIGKLSKLKILNLEGNQLTGDIPVSICDLINLEQLVLSYNQLTGKIPENIGNLSQLIHLILGGNSLTGNLPASIGELKNLEILYLRQNQLNGSLPPQLGNTTNLQALQLGFNSFNESVPSQLGNLENLKMLSLENNQFSGNIPPELGKLSLLEKLDLKSNQLTGAVPIEIINLPNLQEINLYYNNLTDLPSPESTNHIITMRVFGNNFTFEDILPYINIENFSYSPQNNIGKYDTAQTISGEAFLIDLHIDGSISDNVYTWFKDGKEFTTTDKNKLSFESITPNDAGIYSCQITNSQVPNLILYTEPNIIKVSLTDGKSIPESDSLALVALYNSTNGDNWMRNDNWLEGPANTWYGVTTHEFRVTEIILNNNSLNGKIPKEIGDLKKLYKLYLHSNDLTGEIPQEIGLLSNLNYLDLKYNKLTGKIPQSLFQLDFLFNLILNNNQLSGSIPLEQSDRLYFRVLFLHNNKLSGHIPNEIKHLINLQYLDLSGNQLTGSIPNEIGNLTHLLDLNLSDNLLSSPLPNSLWELKNLYSLNLSINRFEGNLPSDIRNLSQLSLLNLADNLFNGNIPKELGELIHLRSIYLSRNQLTGSIPKELGNLKDIKILFLDTNELSGEIPKELGHLSNLFMLSLGGNYLSGEIPNEFENLNKLRLLVLSDNLLDKIPQELNQLTLLDYINISGNNLNSLPVLSSLEDLTVLRIERNELTFEDILPNLSALDSITFLYSPQDSIGQTKTITINPGGSFTIDLGIDSAITTNEYRWFKDSVEIAITNQNSFTITDVTPEDAGVYTCEVTNPAVDSLTLYSRSVTLIIQAEPLPQIITFDSIPDKTYGDEPFLLSATSYAGLEVFFEVVSGPATLFGDTVILTGAGEVTVKAFNEGNENHGPALVERSFTIAKASQTITFDSIPDKTLGDAPFALTASASSGLPVSFHVEGPALLDGTTLTLTDTGKVTITSAQPGNENYLPAEEVIRSFVVKAATFSLSGKVKTQAGDPVGSGAVILYTPNEADRLTTLQTGVLQTDGSYAFTDLKAGEYSVGVIPDDPAFLTTYLGDVVIRSEATLISLFQNTENQYITLISKTETLTGNATLSGILILEENNGGNRILTGAAELEGTPLPEVAVYLINASGDVVAHDVTDAEGKFSFTNVAAGSYHFKADYEGMPHDTDNFTIEVSDKDMEVTALVAEEGIIRVQEVNVVTGTADERTQAPVLLYPNPTEGKFAILVDTQWVGGALLIHNMHGQSIVQKPIHSTKLTFDMSQEKAGVYVVTLQKDENYQIMRVSKF